MFSVGDAVALIAVFSVGGKVWWDLHRLEQSKVDKDFCDKQMEWLGILDEKIESLNNSISDIKEGQARIETSLDFILKKYYFNEVKNVNK